MVHRVTIRWPGESVAFDADPADSLVDAAKRAGVAVSHLCGRGDCQQCVGRIVSGETASLWTATDELPEGHSYLCSRAARADLEIDLDRAPLETSRPVILPAKVRAVEPVAAGVVRLRLGTPPGRRVEFVGGQYAVLRLRDGLERKYSIADVDAAGEVHFYVRLVEGGAFSTWLGEGAAPGTLLQIEAPHGRFVLLPEPAERTLMVATGTGIVPFLAMLRGADVETIAAGGTTTLLWGNRGEADLFAVDELERECARLGVAFRTVFSRQPDRHPARRVTDVPSGDDFAGARVYAAGHPDMVRDLRRLAFAHGLAPSGFHADPFVFTEWTKPGSGRS